LISLRILKVSPLKSVEGQKTAGQTSGTNVVSHVRGMVCEVARLAQDVETAKKTAVRGAARMAGSEGLPMPYADSMKLTRRHKATKYSSRNNFPILSWRQPAQ
jgi:hypothetical protein